MKKNYKILLIASILCLLISFIMLILGLGEKIGPPLVFFFLLLALALRGHDTFKGFSFTILIFAAVTVSMYYPSYFVSIGSFQLKLLIVPLLQIIMFGMGTAMSLKRGRSPDRFSKHAAGMSSDSSTFALVMPRASLNWSSPTTMICAGAGIRRFTHSSPPSRGSAARCFATSSGTSTRSQL